MNTNDADDNYYRECFMSACAAQISRSPNEDCQLPPALATDLGWQFHAMQTQTKILWGKTSLLGSGMAFGYCHEGNWFAGSLGRFLWGSQTESPSSVHLLGVEGGC